MPESRLRAEAARKRKKTNSERLAAKRAERERLGGGGDRSWVPWVFVPVGLLGVIWLVLYYIIGGFIPGITGGWNILIGMGMMAASFIIATLWK